MHNCTSMLGCHYRHLSLKTPKSVCNKNQAHKAIQRSPLCITESDHGYILYEIKRRDTIDYERKTSVDDRCE